MRRIVWISLAVVAIAGLATGGWMVFGPKDPATRRGQSPDVPATDAFAGARGRWGV